MAANTRLVNDLVTHVVGKTDRIMNDTMRLIDDEIDIYAFLVTIVASNVSSLASTLAHTDARFAKLGENERLLVVLGILTAALTGGKPCTVQQKSDILAMISRYPQVELT